MDTGWVGVYMEFERYSECITKKENKRVVSVTVKLVMDDCSGELWITDMALTEGDCVSGYSINTKEMLATYSGEEAVEGKRFFNGVIRGTDTIIVPNLGETSAGMDFKIYPKDAMKAGSVVLATGTGAHTATFTRAVNADDTLELLASTRECLKNGKATEKKGFFQYCAACDSKHTVTVEKGKSARILVAFQEMQNGSELI